MRRLALATLASLALAAAGTARAGSFTYDLNVLANGPTPAVGPITATIADVAGSPGTVRFTLDLSGAPTAEYADLWYFNFSGNNTQLSNLKFTRNTSLSTSTIGTVAVATRPDGYGSGSGLGGNAGLFDIKFTLPNANAARLGCV